MSMVWGLPSAPPHLWPWASVQLSPQDLGQQPSGGLGQGPDYNSQQPLGRAPAGPAGPRGRWELESVPWLGLKAGRMRLWRGPWSGHTRLGWDWGAGGGGSFVALEKTRAIVPFAACSESENIGCH